MRKIVVSFVLIAVLLSPGSVFSQVCGDANDDGSTNILDILSMVDYITEAAPAPINVANADCDGNAGVTISDVSSLSGSLFGWDGQLDCSASGSYSFVPAPNDTVFFPRLLGIPDSVSEVYLPVYVSSSDIITGVYLPFLKSGIGSNGVFDFDSVRAYQSSGNGNFGGVGSSLGSDTVTIFSSSFVDGSSIVVAQPIFLLKYVRVTSGTGNIAPELVDRSSDWKPSVVKGRDLFSPTIEYYDFPSTSGLSLTMSQDNLLFNATVDSVSSDTILVNFTSAGWPLTFYLVPSDMWIGIEEWINPGFFPYPTYTTPASATITADATALGVFDYTGMMTVYLDGYSLVLDTIDVTLSVHPQGSQQFPPGDVNCDGTVDIIDVTYLVLYLFLGGPPPFPCQ
ncbi:MAG: dockerin type I domain-containing protein [Candidatus Zixiibacteriota bacterium]